MPLLANSEFFDIVHGIAGLMEKYEQLASNNTEVPYEVNAGGSSEIVNKSVPLIKKVTTGIGQHIFVWVTSRVGSVLAPLEKDMKDIILTMGIKS